MKKNFKWNEQLKKAKEVLIDYEGEFKIVDANYIAFKFIAKDFVLVFYPHQTSARHHHIRVRNENSKNIFKASEAMWKLANSENNCTFNVKNIHALWGEERFRQAVIRGV